MCTHQAQNRFKILHPYILAILRAKCTQEKNDILFWILRDLSFVTHVRWSKSNKNSLLYDILKIGEYFFLTPLSKDPRENMMDPKDPGRNIMDPKDPVKNITDPKDPGKIQNYKGPSYFSRILRIHYIFPRILRMHFPAWNPTTNYQTTMEKKNVNTMVYDVSDLLKYLAISLTQFIEILLDNF